MPLLLNQQLQHCSSLQEVLDCLLSRSLEVTGAVLGNVQLMDWKAGYLTIAAQRGFNDEFLNFFHRIRLESETACARAIGTLGSVIIEDVLLDRAFTPYRAVALEAGFRAVQSTSLISKSGALLGVVSTHFPKRHRPSDSEMRAMRAIGELTANAIIHQRVRTQRADGTQNSIVRSSQRFSGQFPRRATSKGGY
jgi:GAF domain-containing protein